MGATPSDNKKIVKDMEEKLKLTKNYYEEEIKKMKDEFKKEKDNYALIVNFNFSSISFTNFLLSEGVIPTPPSSFFFS